MKTKLLRRSRKKVKLYKRNNDYIVEAGQIRTTVKGLEDSLDMYRYFVLKIAQDKFGFRPKKVIK